MGADSLPVGPEDNRTVEIDVPCHECGNAAVGWEKRGFHIVAVCERH